MVINRNNNKMNNLSVQKEFGWCNVHVLANLLRDESFKEYLSNDEYKSGDSDMVTELLHMSGYEEWDVTPIIGTVTDIPPIPTEYLLKIINLRSDDNQVPKHFKYTLIPYILTVQLKEPYYHSVAVCRCGNKFLYIEPYIEEVKIIQLEEIPTFFKHCIGIDRITTKIGKQKGYIIFNGAETDFLEILKPKEDSMIIQEQTGWTTK